MRKLFSLLLCSFTVFAAFANDPTDSLAVMEQQLKMLDSIESRLHYRTGSVKLQNGTINLNIPAQYKFLDAADARYIVEDVWGNLKGQALLGMLVPANNMAAIADYAFIISYDEMGYVKDNDAADINYDDLLKEMKHDATEANKERQELGLSSMELLGWANKPLYDEAQNVLYWAKEYKVTGNEINTLNYDVRILGRKGVLVMQAVSDMQQLDSVEKNIDPLLNALSFSAGNRYSDFNETTDNIAAWTIGGLVAGKVLAKAGLFAFIMKFLKVIVLGAIALFGGVVKYFKRKKSSAEPEPAYEENATEQV
jgi:uncharacterized membrane-anchored protein